MKNRKKIEAYTLKYISLIDKSGTNSKMYQELFKAWSDAKFKLWIDALKSGDAYVTIVAPNGGPVKLDTSNNLKIGKMIGIDFFQGFEYSAGGMSYRVTVPTLMAHYNIRRLKQHGVKGLSTAEHGKARNVLTGQVTGDSKSGRITAPEIDVLVGRGLHTTVKELLGSRGGNKVATRQLVNKIIESGDIKMSDLEPFLDGRTSVKTLKSIFKAMHIDINL